MIRLSQLGLALAMAVAAASPLVAPTAFAQTALPGTTAKPPAPAATMPTTAMPNMTMPAKPAAAASMMAPININTATAEQLDTIPHIGPKRAAAIIKGRPYKSVDEVLTKKALSKGIFEKVKSHLTV